MADQPFSAWLPVCRNLFQRADKDRIPQLPLLILISLFIIYLAIFRIQAINQYPLDFCS